MATISDVSKLHSKTVASYVINNERVDVVLCWQGRKPEEDKDRFYDLYTSDGVCMNEGDPWYDNDEGIPSLEEVRDGLWKRS